MSWQVSTKKKYENCPWFWDKEIFETSLKFLGPLKFLFSDNKIVFDRIFVRKFYLKQLWKVFMPLLLYRRVYLFFMWELRDHYFLWMANRSEKAFKNLNSFTNPAVKRNIKYISTFLLFEWMKKLENNCQLLIKKRIFPIGMNVKPIFTFYTFYNFSASVSYRCSRWRS